MSLEARRAVWEHSRAKGTTRLVLLCIAEHANERGLAWPGFPRLAAHCNMSDRTVRYAVDELVGLGELERVRRRGRTRSNHYRVLLPGAQPENRQPAAGFDADPPENRQPAAGIPEENRQPAAGFGEPDPAKTGSPLQEKPAAGCNITVIEPPLLLRPPVPIADANGEDRAEAMHAVLSAFADRGYNGTPRFLGALARAHPRLDLELEAEKVAEWLTEPRNAKRKCSKRFLDNWLKRAEADAAQREAAPAPGPQGSRSYAGQPPPGGLVHPNSQRRNPGPDPVLPDGVELQPVKPADVERELAERKRIPYEQRLALMRTGAAPAGGAA